jgi:hypothetical protein
MPPVGRPRKPRRDPTTVAAFAKQALEEFCRENSEALRGATVPDVLSALALAGSDLPPGVVRELVESYVERARPPGPT